MLGHVKGIQEVKRLDRPDDTSAHSFSDTQPH